MMSMYGGNQRVLDSCETLKVPQTLKERLESEKLNLERRLEGVNKALDALKKNPELQNLIDLVSQVWY